MTYRRLLHLYVATRKDLFAMANTPENGSKWKRKIRQTGILARKLLEFEKAIAHVS
jgi:hypothetical protein